MGQMSALPTLRSPEYIRNKEKVLVIENACCLWRPRGYRESHLGS